MSRAAFVRFALVFGVIFVQVVDGQQGCADQLQRCGGAAEQYEQQIRAMKAVAFRTCVSQPACQSEMVAFDECFLRTLRTVRQPSAQALTLTGTVGDVVSTSEQFRLAIDRCFLAPSSAVSTFSEFGRTSESTVDSSKAYIAAVYSADFADLLWGLKFSPASNDPNACPFSGRDLTLQRLFGNGISRTVDSADPRFNNLNTSCYLNDLELQCYRTRLENDPRYQQLVDSRDQAINTCIQSIRLQTQCRPNSNDGQMLSCLCNAKEEFELRLQKDLLECVRQSPVSQRQTASLLGARSQIFPEQFASAPLSSNDRLSQPANQQMTPGIVRNGQCLCACQNSLATPQGARPQAEAAPTLVNVQSLPWYQNNQYPSEERTPNSNANWPGQYPDYAQTYDSFYWNNPGRWSGNRNNPNQRRNEESVFNREGNLKTADSI
uniref:Uncharacterized protein n=1 Tax=Plectus sambesii TaxID=2011161 RepID=A0A914UL44_9BILA